MGHDRALTPPPPDFVAPRRRRRRPAAGLAVAALLGAMLAGVVSAGGAGAQSVPTAWIHGEHRQLFPGSDRQIYELGDVDEGVAAVFTVNISAVQSAAVTVNVRVSESTGGARDYITAANEKVHQVVIAAGDTSADLSVPTVADSSDEATGRVTAAIESGSGYSIASGAHRKTSAGIDVYDDDATSVRFTGWSGRGIPGDGYTIVGRTISFAEGDTFEVVLEVGRPLVAGESLSVPVVIGGTATVGCEWVACDVTLGRQVGVDQLSDATLRDYRPNPSPTVPGRSAANKDPRWGFRGLYSADTAGFVIDMPDTATGESPTEFRLRVSTFTAGQSVTGEGAEALTFRLEHRPTTLAFARGVESRGLARYTPGSGSYGGEHVAANATAWTMFIADNPAAGDVHFMDQTDEHPSTSDTENCIPTGNPAKVVLTEGTIGKWCHVHLQEKFGSTRIPPSPLTFSVTTSNPNAVKLEHGIEGATPGSFVRISFANDTNKTWGAYHAIRLVPQNITGNQTATITQTVTGGGPEYAAMNGTRTFTVEVRDAPAGQSDGHTQGDTQNSPPPDPVKDTVDNQVCALPTDAVTTAEVTGWRDAHPGAAHTLRWNRVLAALGQDNGTTPLTTAESETNENKYMRSRWNRVTRTLTAHANCHGTTSSTDNDDSDGSDSDSADDTPPPAADYSDLIAQMRQWRNDPQWRHHKTHTDRWDRALLALGQTIGDPALTPMTAAEAQTFANRGMTRWEPVAQALHNIEQTR